MLKLILIGTIGLILIVTFTIIIKNKPEFWFWIFLNIFFDPGGYVYAFLGGTLGPLPIVDLAISGMVLCLFVAKINWKTLFQDDFFKKYLVLLLIFSVYYFIVYGGVVPYYQNDFNYSTFLIKNRVFAYSIFILIAVYAFSIRSLYYFYTSTLFFGVISLTLFFISVLTGTGLAPIEEDPRYIGSEMMRIAMVGYGIFYLLFPVSIIVYILSKRINLKLKYKFWLYYGGIVFTLAQIITLTRRVQIEIIGALFVISLLFSYLFRIGKLSSLLKTVIPAILVILILFFTFPKYIGYWADVGEDTFLLITTGKDTRGQSDQRVSGNQDYELVKKYIKENLFFGTGYTYLYWEAGYAHSARGEEFSTAADAAGEVNIYYLLFGFGLVGALLMIPLYYVMVKLFFKLIRLLRSTLSNLFEESLTIVFSIYILSVVASKFTYKLWGLSSDFTGAAAAFTAVLMGIGLALLRKITLYYYVNINSTSNQNFNSNLSNI